MSNNWSDELLDSQKFEIKKAIAEAGFAVSEFTFASVDSFKMQSCNVPVVSHKKTGSAFAFDFEEHESSGRRQRYSVRRPGTESAMETIQAQSWNEQMNHVREWLLLIRRELNPAGFQPPLEKTARLGPGPDSWPSSSSSNIMIFISHSSADATMAEALADLLRTALSIPPER